jgi:Fanconi anemia group M protein
MQEAKIIVDNRERNLEIVNGLEESGLKLVFSQLPVGDYILSDRICVERKTASDLENSIINSRLFEQLERLKASFEKPMLIIEGNGYDFRLNGNVILGAVLKVYVDYGIQVLWSNDSLETADVLAAIAKREQNRKEREPRLLGLKKAYTEYQWQLLILSSIPGIGTKLARNLLDHFKSIRSIVTADIEELMEIDKIGKKKAARIYEILNKEYEHQDLDR